MTGHPPGPLPGLGEEPTAAGRRQTGWTLGMVVVAGAVAWSVALGPVVALMSGGQISIWDGWFALPAGASDEATLDAALPGFLTMLAIGTAGLAVAGLVRIVSAAMSRRGQGDATRTAAPD